MVASEEIDLWYTENNMEYSFDRVDLYNFENGSSVSLFFFIGNSIRHIFRCMQ